MEDLQRRCENGFVTSAILWKLKARSSTSLSIFNLIESLNYQMYWLFCEVGVIMLLRRKELGKYDFLSRSYAVSSKCLPWPFLPVQICFLLFLINCQVELHQSVETARDRIGPVTVTAFFRTLSVLSVRHSDVQCTIIASSVQVRVVHELYYQQLNATENVPKLNNCSVNARLQIHVLVPCVSC